MRSLHLPRLRFGPTGLLAVALAATFCLTAIPAMAADTAWLGVNLQPLDDDLREAMGIDRRVRGALVSRVLADGPAEAAGLRADDVIVEVDGRRVGSVEETVEAVRDHRVGETVRIVVNRRGAERGLSVELGELARTSPKPSMVPKPDDEGRHIIIHRDGSAPKVLEWRGDEDDDSEAPEAFEWRSGDDDEGKIFIVRPKRLAEEFRDQAREFRRQARDMARSSARGGFLGVTTQGLSDQLAEYFDVDEGVLVTSVVDGSAADEAGIRAGDVILAVDDDEVGDPDDLRDAVRGHEPGDDVTIRISRDGSVRTLRAELKSGGDMQGFDFRMPEAPRAPRMRALPPVPDVPPVPNLRHRELLDEQRLQELHEKDREAMDRFHEQIERMHEQLAPRERELQEQMEALQEKLHELELKLRELERDRD